MSTLPKDSRLAGTQLADPEWRKSWQIKHDTWIPAPPVECSPSRRMGTVLVETWVRQIMEAVLERVEAKNARLQC